MVVEHNSREADKLKRRVTYVAAVVNLFLSVLKIVYGIMGQSSALIADGIHSLSDLASDAFVLFAVILGSREADHEHPYGHRRFETMATVILGIGLIVIGVGIAWDAVERLLHPDRLLIPTKEALVIAAISIVANEWLYQYTKHIARKTRSKLLLANAWHHRSDAISSVIVLFGVVAVLYGYSFADALAAVIVALMVSKIGLTLVLESIKELVDTSLPSKFVDQITSVIMNTGGVEGIHLLRTRQMGEDAFVDAHIVVDPRITVSEGHMIGDEVRDNLISRFDDIIDVLVHIDPEDDEFKTQTNKTLSRREVHAVLEHYLGNIVEKMHKVNIHYLDGYIELEVVLPHAMASQQQKVEKIKEQCVLMEKQIETITRVLVFIKA